jgi:hypothetical protein
MTPLPEARMLHWKQLARESNEQLGARDLALTNVACAEGLPGAPTEEDAARCIKWIDQRAKEVRRYTKECYTEYHVDPAKYDHSGALFRLVCMTRLLTHAGLRYNPAKIPVDAVFEPADSFIHGAILGRGGTCGSLPVVYVAVGRRLGYPLKLVKAREHLFFRWDQPGGERYNFEVNNDSSNSHPDDYYRSGRYYITPEEERDGLALVSMTPRMELASFLVQRGNHWRQLGDYRLATEAYLSALELVPENVWTGCCIESTLRLWEKRARAATPPPPHWPGVTIEFPSRRYPSVPQELEYRAVLWEVVEEILSRPEWDMKQWRATGVAPMSTGNPFRVIAPH